MGGLPSIATVRKAPTAWPERPPVHRSSTRSFRIPLTRLVRALDTPQQDQERSSPGYRFDYGENGIRATVEVLRARRGDMIVLDLLVVDDTCSRPRPPREGDRFRASFRSDESPFQLWRPSPEGHSSLRGVASATARGVKPLSNQRGLGMRSSLVVVDGVVGRCPGTPQETPRKTFRAAPALLPPTANAILKIAQWAWRRQPALIPSVRTSTGTRRTLGTG